MTGNKKKGVQNSGGSAPAETLARFSDVLLQLYRDARSPKVNDFQTRAFERIKTLIPLDTGAWVRGVIDLDPGVAYTGMQIIDGYRYNLPPSMAQGFSSNIQKKGLIAKVASQTPGVTVNACLREWYPDRSMWPYFDQFGLQHELQTHFPNPVTGLTSAIVIYRADLNNPFTEQERLIKQTLMPHLVDAAAQAQIAPWIEDHTGEQSFPCSAIADQSGMLRHATDDFSGMLQKQWPGWRGPHLPPPLREIVTKGENGHFVGGEINVRINQGMDLALLLARPGRLTDQLSKQQLIAARHSANGASYKQIARSMDLSPATVRNYLTIIYRKLEVKNKTQLAEALREVE